MPKMSPTPLTPGALLQAGLVQGYTHLLIVKHQHSPVHIVGGYTSAKLAEKAKASTVLKLNRTLSSSVPFPEVSVVLTIDAWDELRHNMRPEWAKWLANSFVMAAVAYSEVPLAEAMARVVAWEHRTIQQSVMRAIKCFLGEYIKQGTGTDARNEAGHLWARAAAGIAVEIPRV